MDKKLIIKMMIKFRNDKDMYIFWRNVYKMCV